MLNFTKIGKPNHTSHNFSWHVWLMRCDWCEYDVVLYAGWCNVTVPVVRITLALQCFLVSNTALTLPRTLWKTSLHTLPKNTTYILWGHSGKSWSRLWPSLGTWAARSDRLKNNNNNNTHIFQTFLVCLNVLKWKATLFVDRMIFVCGKTEGVPFLQKVAKNITSIKRSSNSKISNGSSEGRYSYFTLLGKLIDRI